jgi:hypothetical protein
VTTPSRIKLPRIGREVKAPRICHRCRKGECHRCTMKGCACLKCGFSCDGKRVL